MAILDTYKSYEKERVQLAVLKQCAGSYARLGQLVDLAKTDYRDALVGAEYPEESRVSVTYSRSLKKIVYEGKTAQEMDEIRRGDRDQYEAWLNSDRTTS